MNPESAEGGAAGPGNQLRNEVPHRVGQQRKHESADDVPARDVQVFQTARKKRRQKLDDRQHQRQNDEGIDHQRELGPLQRLAETGEHQHPAGRDHRKVPQPEYPLPEPRAGDGSSREQWHGVIKKREERVAEPPQHDSLRVVVTEPAPTQPGPVSAQPSPGRAARSTPARRNATEISSVMRAAKPCAYTSRVSTAGEAVGRGLSFMELDIIEQLNVDR